MNTRYANYLSCVIPLSISAGLLISCASSLKTVDQVPSEIVVETAPHVWQPTLRVEEYAVPEAVAVRIEFPEQHLTYQLHRAMGGWEAGRNESPKPIFRSFLGARIQEFWLLI